MTPWTQGYEQLESAVGKTRRSKVLTWKVRHGIGKNEVEKFGLKVESLG